MEDKKQKIELELEDCYMNDVLKMVEDYPEKLTKKEALVHLIDTGFVTKMQDLALSHNMKLVDD